MVGRFALRLSFRALRPNGILMSMLSSDNAASEYLVVYLRGGYITVSMSSSSRSVDTRSVTLKHRYDNTYWWQVTHFSVLVIIIIIIVTIIIVITCSSDITADKSQFY